MKIIVKGIEFEVSNININYKEEYVQIWFKNNPLATQIVFEEIEKVYGKINKIEQKVKLFAGKYKDEDWGIWGILDEVKPEIDYVQITHTELGEMLKELVDFIIEE